MSFGRCGKVVFQNGEHLESFTLVRIVAPQELLEGVTFEDSDLSNTVTASLSIVNDMKDMTILQFKSQELDCEQHKLACEAVDARQIELMLTLKENS